MERLVEYHRSRPKILDRPGAVPLAVRHGAIRFEAVRFHYRGHDRPLFDGLDVAIRPGERVALVGRSGSGKTTFTKLLQRLLEIQGGRILIDGQDIAGATLESLRRAIALVPQEPILFHRSLAENIAYARPTPARTRWSGRRAWRTRTSSLPGCLRATTRWSASAG
jgi:ATP-binding cassette subfamily B protein